MFEKDMENKKNILFVTSDEYPFKGANTNILLSLFETGIFLKNYNVYFLSKKPASIVNEKRKNIFYYNEPNVNIKLLDLNNYKNRFLITCIKLVRIIYFTLYSLKLCNNKLINTVYRSLKTIHNVHFDLIIPIMGGKFYETAASLKYSKHYKVPIGLYQVDPCANNECEGKNSKNARFRFEKELYKRSLFIVTTPLIYKIHSTDPFSKYQSKMYKMEFPLVSDKTLSSKRSKQGIVTCVFAGALYETFRTPYYTVKLFENLKLKEDVVLLFVGENCLKYGEKIFSHNVIWKESETRREVSELLNSSTFLVNIGNDNNNQVPSKIFDYISRGKPIINVCKSKECPTLPYLSQYPLALNIIEDDKEVDSNRMKLASFIEEFKNSTAKYDTIKGIYYKCTSHYCASYFTNIVDSFLSKEPL